MKELKKSILLEDIDHKEKSIYKAIGVTKEEFDECWEKLRTTKGECFVEFAKEFDFDPNELFETLKKVDYETEAIVALWEKRERTHISLEEFIQTKVIIHAFRNQMLPKFSPATIIIFPPFLARYSRRDELKNEKKKQEEKEKSDRLFYT